MYKTPLWIYILVGFCCDLLMIYLKRVAHVEHQWISHIYIIAELLLISWYYKDHILNKSTALTLIFTGIFFYIVTAALGTEFNQHNVNGTGAAGLALLYIILSFAGYFNILKEQLTPQLENSSFFWANTSILLYSSGSIIIFICIDYMLISDTELLYTIWVFRNVVNVIKNTLFTRALTLGSK